jgi:hypothetical protein
MKIRKTYVAGYFYPSKKEEIEDLLKKIRVEEGIENMTFSEKVIGAIVPHAGYIYSAHEALYFFEGLRNYKEKFDTVVIINPNHNGVGKDIALSSYDYWDSPYEKVEVDREFQDGLGFYEDDSAHNREHSGEVMIPLLKYALDYDFKIVPISIKNQGYKSSKVIAEKLFERGKETEKNILIIASSDFSHYEEVEASKSRDNYALEAIKDMDSILLENRVHKERLSICGYGAIMVLIEYSKLVGGVESKILRRGHSGEITGESGVVNYNTILFHTYGKS